MRAPSLLQWSSSLLQKELQLYKITTGYAAIASIFGVYRPTSGRPLVQCLPVGRQQRQQALQKGIGHAAGLRRKYMLARLFVLLITVAYRYSSGRDVVAWSIDLSVHWPRDCRLETRFSTT
jgi:hypothetical protein